MLGADGSHRPGGQGTWPGISVEVERALWAVRELDARARVHSPSRRRLSAGAAPSRPRRRGVRMQGPLRGLLAGVAAWKLGGGCISTIVVFVLVFWLLGSC